MIGCVPRFCFVLPYFFGVLGRMVLFFLLSNSVGVG